MTAPIELDLEALEAAANAAIEKELSGEPWFTDDEFPGLDKEDREHIATAEPAVVLELVRRLRAAEALAGARIEQIPTDAKMVMVCTDLVMRHELSEQFEEFSEAIKKRCTSGQWTLVAFFPEATDIQTMDAEQLRAAGLVRAQASERGGE